ncbi:hypothetical protein CK203_109533 [Vitis vinifera]|uniref:Endonuclease/exonuclease/phosphatase domain-containing protein n=1 Tax=Vitis vinifera TaxID=29760 RepID=A0A438DGB1_VITVI|nr:hypothetical protein CK203_109533 [Vitis vinifera]
MEQGRSASPLKSYIPGMFPISFALGGVSGESSGLSSPFLSGMGDSVGYSQSRQPEGMYEDPLEFELPLCMVLKDGRSFTLPVGEGEKDKSPWVNRKFLGKPNESKRGTLSGSRKDRELKKLVNTINYDGLAGRVAEEGELGRQITVEIKMKEMPDRIVRSLGIGRNLGWVSLDARGSAGGVLYGPIKGRERRELWEELAAVKGLWNDPWCIVGDFNVVRFLVEMSNGKQMSTTMREFLGFIDEFELVDPPLGGGAFTWSGGEGGSLKARLDRFLFSGDWEERVLGAMQFLLLRPVSDHSPILLDCGGMRKGKNPFRFENMWLRVEGFMDKFKEWWQSYNFRGKPSFVFAKKLQALKYDLKMWNKETLGNVSVRKDATLEKQKSRALWLKEGDSNTKFFHRMANARRRGNFISSLTVRGVRLNKEEELKEGIGSYFKSLFEEPLVRRPDVESGLFKILDSFDNEILEEQFSEEEVSKALSDLGGDKAPRPDGFTLAFWKFCWPIVGGK